MKKRTVSELADEVLRFGDSLESQATRASMRETQFGAGLKAYRRLAKRLARRAAGQEKHLLVTRETIRLLVARIQRLEAEIDRLDPMTSSGPEET